MEKRNIQSEHGTVYYWIARCQKEKASCMVFTHGLTADHTSFDRQMQYFSRDYHVLAWDVPLHGESRPYRDFSYKNAAGELKTILDAEQIDKVILVGHSMGGYVCQEFAILYPDYVNAFVAVDTSPFGHEYYTAFERYIVARAGKMASFYPYHSLIKGIAKRSSKTPYAYENLFAAVSKLSKKEICTVMDLAYGDFLTRKETVSFHFPVLLLLGESDRTGYVPKYTKAWAQKTGYPLRIISNAAHCPNLDNEPEFNQTVRDFLLSLPQ